jgi:hypothetical protein
VTIEIPEVVRPFASRGRTRLSGGCANPEVDVEKRLGGGVGNDRSKNGQQEELFHNASTWLTSGFNSNTPVQSIVVRLWKGFPNSAAIPSVQPRSTLVGRRMARGYFWNWCCMNAAKSRSAENQARSSRKQRRSAEFDDPRGGKERADA